MSVSYIVDVIRSYPSLFILAIICILLIKIQLGKKTKAKLEENTQRLEELKLKPSRTPEEEAEVTKLESWIKRYQNRSRPKNSDTNP